MKVWKALGTRPPTFKWRLFSQSTGWKRAAIVNCVLLCVASIILLSLTITTSVRAHVRERGIQALWLFFEGQCNDKSITYVNFILHLLLNIFSTLILASTNFFTQILNAPTREDIDAAHAHDSAFEIGVSSIRNLFKVPKFKGFCWLGLLITSIPIHVFFNSTIFETEYRVPDYRLTIATEKFVNGAPFFPPGASLMTADTIASNYLGTAVGFRHGAPASVREYKDKNSTAMRHLSSIRNMARTWDKLEISQCISEYHTEAREQYSGLSRHRDLVVVIDKPDGWIRSQMWNLSEPIPYQIFGPGASLVPSNASNHLFFDTACNWYNCSRLFQPFEDYPEESNSFFSFSKSVEPSIYYSLREGSDKLKALYCLADSSEFTCHVGLSPALLLIVTLSVVIKSGIALLVTYILPRQDKNPLVTIGDTIASFIEKPDPNTAGFACFDLTLRYIIAEPQAWQKRTGLRWAVIPRSVWIRSYTLFLSVVTICILASMFVAQGGFGGPFLASATNAIISVAYCDKGLSIATWKWE